MTDFDIKSFIEQNNNVILVTNYWSKNDIPFYIIRPKEGHFLKFEDHSNKMFGKFLAYSRDDNSTPPIGIHFNFGVFSRVSIGFQYDDIELESYLNIFGVYHFKKYLDTLDEASFSEDLSRIILVDHKSILEKQYNPNVIDGEIESPETHEEIAFRLRSLRKRILKYLYTSKNIKREFRVNVHDGLILDSVFCDVKDFDNALARLRGEGMLIGDREKYSPLLTISSKGEEAVEKMLGKSEQNNTQSKPYRKLAAIMFTDMVGYTALMEKDEQKARESIERHRNIMKPLVQKYGGEILQFTGDGTFCTFESAIEAVNCSIEMQRKFKTYDEISIRIGIHIGDVVVDGEEVYGEGVNITSRIEPIAEAGGICVSDKVRNEIKNHLDLELISLGIRELKNVSNPIELFKVDFKVKSKED